MSSIDFATDPNNAEPRAGDPDTDARFLARDETGEHAGTDLAGACDQVKQRVGTGRHARADRDWANRDWANRDWAIGEIVDGALFAPVVFS